MLSLSFLLFPSSLLLPTTLAFYGSAPLLVFGNDQSIAFQNTASNMAASSVTDAELMYPKISDLGCDWDAAVVVHVDNLHNSRLSDHSVPRDAHVYIPYLTRSNKRSLDSAVEDWAATCSAKIVDALDQIDGKSLVKLDLEEGSYVPHISSLPPSSVLLITGTHTSHKRQRGPERPFPSITSHISAQKSATTIPTSRPKHNSTIPAGGPLFDRVQILTTPIITSLLISFGIFIPLAAFGVSALAGIQVPPRMLEIGKGMIVGKERKDQ
ncbi:uncharacterized protein L203_101630 [Cryptococcus depauperatus CBS 7841]|uniref:Protein BIG1 n=1 Tax=Cryptococcus depauperatus CBS 7841 TaxID=1295531 RepID=A0AAJ8JQA0_9TREE